MQGLLRRFQKSEIDILILRLSLFVVYATFGLFKWFDFEVEALKPLISNSRLSFLYDWFGFYGASYVLGVIEGITYISLLMGIFSPRTGIIGALGLLGTGVVTLSLLFQLGFSSFIFKDFLLIGGAIVLLKHELNRINP
ncbi:YkgB family protein [Actinobacillus equuli subsp. haemolyticus]|nr:YkgB family protein [Actinobacillus equuli subsp. haemolyticus]